MNLCLLYLTSTGCTSALPTSQVELEISGLRVELGELRFEVAEERRNLANAIIEVAQMNTILGKKGKIRILADWLILFLRLRNWKRRTLIYDFIINQIC